MVCKGEECKNYWSCRYLQNRLNTLSCNYDKKEANRIHKEELKVREEMLKKFNNYGRDM